MEFLKVAYQNFRKSIKSGVFDDPNEIIFVQDNFIKLEQFIKRYEKIQKKEEKKKK